MTRKTENSRPHTRKWSEAQAACVRSLTPSLGRYLAKADELEFVVKFHFEHGAMIVSRLSGHCENRERKTRLCKAFGSPTGRANLIDAPGRFWSNTEDAIRQSISFAQW
jgi:hypothetical protein